MTLCWWENSSAFSVAGFVGNILNKQIHIIFSKKEKAYSFSFLDWWLSYLLSCLQACITSQWKTNRQKLTQKLTSKNDILEDGTSTSNQSKKLSHETGIRPKSDPLSSTLSYASGNSSNGSFLSNFAPRWGRSQSYSNTTSVSNTWSNKTFKVGKIISSW